MNMYTLYAQYCLFLSRSMFAIDDFERDLGRLEEAAAGLGLSLHRIHDP